MELIFSRDPFFRDFDRAINAHLNAITSTDPTSDASGNNKLSKFWSGSFNARLDLTESEKNYVVHADLPGVNKDEVKVAIKDDVLTISGERSDKREIKDETRHIVERSQGKFSRSIRLPTDANADDVKAKMENGVLELTVAKKAKTDGAKTITIQ